ncbi:hypothetical protein [Streptomyces luteireticuli]|uniref:terpene synthase family protein n=1 Tax=Streptomyces luteireticuli TaxID=173858 RepID=UPI0035577214
MLHTQKGTRLLGEEGPLDTSAISIPPVYCPIASAIHPNSGTIQARSIEWITGLDYFSHPTRLPRIIGSRAGQLSARLAPDGFDDHVQTTADVFTWQFAFDDDRCDNSELGHDSDGYLCLLAELLAVTNTLDAEPPSDDPYIILLHGLWRRIRDQTPPGLAHRIMDANREWLVSMAIQASSAARGNRSLNHYAVYRQWSGAHLSTCANLENSYRVHVPPQEFHSPRVRAATAAVGLIVCWDNDLFSYRKEITGQQVENNALLLVMEERGCSLQEAVDIVVAQRDRTVCLFLKLRELLLPTASHELHEYLKALGHYIRGCLDWYLTTPRYTHIGGSDGYERYDCLTLPVGWADTPSDSTLEPIEGLPAVAWWWDQL